VKFLSVCSGIEAASVAWKPLGWTAVAFAEIEPFPCAVLAHHYPDVPNWGDMTKYQEWPDADFDVLCGGTPCQSFSVAGLRKGLADPRGNLMLTFGAIAAKYRPKWLVWENVPGVLSSNAGRDFGSFLGLLGELGYGFAYRILDAQYVRVESHPRAVPQRRRRVFVVGHLGDWRRAAAVLFERESLSGHPAPSRQAGQGFAACAAPSLTASGRGVERTGETRGQDPVIAVQAFGGNNTSGAIDVATARSASASASASGRMDFESETFLVAGAPVGVDGFNGQITGDVAATMGTRGSSETASGPQAMVPIAFSAKDHGADAMDDCSPTLRAGGHAGSHANAGVMPAIAYIADDYKDGPFEEADLARPLTTSTDRTRAAPIIGGMQVRRLTPLETERLMGQPDNYTAIQIRGKPAADGPRYKSHGNSWAINCVSWIGERINQVEALTAMEAA
jgi:DNA (cytosine-5)-methyltransferase 1